MKALEKLSRISLSALLAAFVCFCPPNLSAFGDEASAAETADASQNVTADEMSGKADQAVEENAPVANALAEDASETANKAVTDEASTQTADNEAEAATTTTDTANTEEATDHNSFDVSNTDEFKAAMDTINATGSGEYTINIVADFELSGHTRKQHHLMPSDGQTITIIGNGHTIAYQLDTSSQLALGSVGGTLNLGKADGTDSLTITLHATDTDDPLLIAYDGGTINMYNGVTLTGNVNRTGLGGGAVDVQNGTFNMYGGTISNCYSTVVTYGGAVCLQGGTFNMYDGTIQGCHEEYGHGRHGFGGAVAIGMTGEADQFNMTGNAVIDDCKAEYGGGVYVYAGNMKMSGNALIENCEAEVVNGTGGLGGGVYVNKGATFDMSDNATITGNTATDGGGIISWGTVAATAVHNNTASNSGDDIYNAGTITLASAKGKNWILNSDGITIDGWYYDGHRETGTTDEDGNAVVEHTRWNPTDPSSAANSSPDSAAPDESSPIMFAMAADDDTATADNAESTSDADTAAPSKYVKEFTNTDVPTNEVMALKAAHDTTEPTTPTTPTDDDINVYWDDDNGTVLYELDDVDSADVPAPGEYNELSGKENPAKPETDEYYYVFDGWDRSTDPAGDVIYTAEYLAIPKAHGTIPGDTPDTPDVPDTPDKPNIPDTHDTPDTPSVPDDNSPVPSEPTNTEVPLAPTVESTANNTTAGNGLAPTGDDNGILAPILIAGMGLSALGIAYSRRKLNQQD